MPRIHDFVNAPVRIPVQAQAAPQPEGGGAGNTQGVFITPQSIVTFPVASFVVGLIWKVIGAVVPSLATALWIPLIVGLAIALLIYWISISDPASTATPRDKQIGLFVAIINGLYLFAATAGIVTAFAPSGGGHQ
jgi:hypothetical protein